MIWESYYWKKDLLKYSAHLEARKKQLKWVDASYANAEKDIMLSAFIIRKLFDSDKIDKRIENKEISLVIYKSNGNKVNKMKNIFPERYFDIEKPTKSKLKVREIYNQIIHSYIFSLLFDEENLLKSFWVASDYNKFKYLVEIGIDNYIDILNEIGNYWSNNEHWVYDPQKEDYNIYHDRENKSFTVLNNISPNNSDNIK